MQRVKDDLERQLNSEKEKVKQLEGISKHSKILLQNLEAQKTPVRIANKRRNGKS